MREFRVSSVSSSGALLILVDDLRFGFDFRAAMVSCSGIEASEPESESDCSLLDERFLISTATGAMPSGLAAIDNFLFFEGFPGRATFSLGNSSLFFFSSPRRVFWNPEVRDGEGSLEVVDGPA